MGGPDPLWGGPSPGAPGGGVQKGGVWDPPWGGQKGGPGDPPGDPPWDPPGGGPGGAPGGPRGGPKMAKNGPRGKKCRNFGISKIDVQGLIQRGVLICPDWESY